MALGRYRFIGADGQERTASGDDALRAALRSGALDTSSMLFDTADERCRPAGTHPVVAASLARLQNTAPPESCAPRSERSLGTEAHHSRSHAKAHGGAADVSHARRFAARLIDMLITPMLALLLVGAVVSMLAADGDNPGTIFWGIIASIVMSPTEALLVAAFGTTPGKRLIEGMRHR